MNKPAHPTARQHSISSSVEMAEDAILPQRYEVHSDPTMPNPCAEELPAAMREPLNGKSPARWAYERIILYIKNFEDQMDSAHEVAIGFVGGGAGVVRIEGIGYFDPDIITFYGTDEDGARTQLIQHVSQLNIMLRALPLQSPAEPPRRIGFQLSRELVTDPAPPE
jgi:hypothetical protein